MSRAPPPTTRCRCKAVGPRSARPEPRQVEPPRDPRPTSPPPVGQRTDRRPPRGTVADALVEVGRRLRRAQAPTSERNRPHPRPARQRRTTVTRRHPHGRPPSQQLPGGRETPARSAVTGIEAGTSRKRPVPLSKPHRHAPRRAAKWHSGARVGRRRQVSRHASANHRTLLNVLTERLAVVVCRSSSALISAPTRTARPVR